MLEDHCADVKVLPEVQTLRSLSARDSATQSVHQFQHHGHLHDHHYLIICLSQ